jgi:hypothetical protein
LGGAASVAYVAAALVNYLLCIAILFRHKARWSTQTELLMYVLVVAAGGFLDVYMTRLLVGWGNAAWLAKAMASAAVLLFNFYGRRLLVFPETRLKPWKPQLQKEMDSQTGPESPVLEARDCSGTTPRLPRVAPESRGHGASRHQ